MTQEHLERMLRDSRPGDVIDLEGQTVWITHPPVVLPEGITVTNGTFTGVPA